jgi:predicted SnoaL-like aldol condensation-catalyzing enzyme
MGTDAKRAAMQRIFDELITGKRLELAEELYADAHELHPDAGIGRGPEGMKAAFAGLHEEFRDVRVDVHSLVAEGDMVAVSVTFHGVHAESGEPAAWPEMVFTRFEDGKAAESWEITDASRPPDAPW